MNFVVYLIQYCKDISLFQKGRNRKSCLIDFKKNVGESLFITMIKGISAICQQEVFESFQQQKWNN